MIAFFVFCLILFLYLHVQFHLRTGDNLEIYEIDQASKDKMEEICDLRQPVLFDCIGGRSFAQGGGVRRGILDSIE